MKKSISVLLSLIMVLSASSLAPVAIPAATGVITAQAATKVKINATKKTLVKGQTYTLKVSGTKKKVKWSTGKKSVATVNSKGKVTAKAKGVSQNGVVYKHILRNALLPIVTGLGMGLSGLIGGSVVIEKIFNWQGIGMLYLEANNNNDYPLMMGIMIFMAAVALLGNLITDLCLGLLDPRVTVE